MRVMSTGGRSESKSARALRRLRRVAVFNLDTAREYGLSQPSVSRLLKRGVILRVGPGIYQLSDSITCQPDTLEFVRAAKRFGPKIVVGGMTALFRYGLVDEVPEQVWLLAPTKMKIVDNHYRVIRTSRSLTVGIVKHGGFRMVSLERAIVDAIVFSTKLGYSTGLQASIRAIKRNLTSESRIFEMAQSLGALKKVGVVWEAVSVALES